MRNARAASIAVGRCQNGPTTVLTERTLALLVTFIASRLPVTRLSPRRKIFETRRSSLWMYGSNDELGSTIVSVTVLVLSGQLSPRISLRENDRVPFSAGPGIAW